VSVASLGTLRSLGATRAVVIGRATVTAAATVAASTSRSAEPSTVTSRGAVAAASTWMAGRVTGEVFGEFQQFGAAQFAVAVLVETHGVLHESLRRGRTARSALTSALSLTTRRTSIGVGTRAIRTGTAGPFSSGTGAVVILSTGPATVAALSDAATSAAATAGAQFVRCQLPVTILVEFLQRRGRIGDLFRGESSVVIRVECLHQWIGRPARAAATRRT